MRVRVVPTCTDGTSTETVADAISSSTAVARETRTTSHPSQTVPGYAFPVQLAAVSSFHIK